MASLRRFCGKVSLAVLLTSCFSAQLATAQDYSGLGISEVVAAADRMLQRGDYEGAIPALREVAARMTDSVDPAQRETLQLCRFQLARALFQTGDPAAGVPILELYLENEPRKDERMALRMLAQGMFDAQNWEKIAELAGRLLQMSNLEEEDLYNGNLLLGQAFFQQEKWAESVAPLTKAARYATDPKIANLCQIMSIRALVESENWYEVFGRIPAVYRTDAKYDISLNLTLMKAGQGQFEAESFLNALLLYRMVLPRETLLEYAQKQLDGLSAELEKGVSKASKEEKESEMESTKASMTSLLELPPYEDEVAFRIGQIYAEVKRYWEGYVLFDQLYQADKNSEIGEASMLQSVLILYDVNEVEKAEQRVLAYLEEKPDGQYARTMLSLMIRNSLQTQNFKKITDLKDAVYSVAPTTDHAEQMLQAEIHYMSAFGYFHQQDFMTAVDEYSVVVDEYKESPSYGDAVYYRGMAFMMQAKYEEALADFSTYQKENDGGINYAAAMFREAVCLFGLERIDEAEKVFKMFLDNYRDDPLASEASSMFADIEASKEASADDPDTLDRALALYRQGIDLAVMPQQASYAAFQAAKVYQMEFKWQEIIDLMNYYIERWEEKADVAKAIYWIGRAQIELGQVDESIVAYMNVIERFGNDASIDGIDKIILELVTISDQHLSADDREDLMVRIKLKLSASENEKNVLNLRLRVCQAYLEGEETAAALGVELLNANQELKEASPLTLALMCDAAVSAEDTVQMERLYTYFLKTYEESDLLWHAYRAKSYQLLAAKDYEGVLAIVDEAQGLFGVEPFMGWAQIMKADTLYQQGEYKEAEVAYNMVMGVPDWRGPIFAEAMYGMGMCRLGVEDYATAHSFFQRTYLLFKSYADGEWAAKGYLAAAKCLLKLDRVEEAQKTLQAMLEDEYTNSSLLADMAREQLKKYGSQE